MQKAPVQGRAAARALRPGLLPCVVGLGGETLLHLLLSEHHFPEHCGDVDLFLTHLDHSFQIEV